MTNSETSDRVSYRKGKNERRGVQRLHLVPWMKNGRRVHRKIDVQCRGASWEAMNVGLSQVQGAVADRSHNQEVPRIERSLYDNGGLLALVLSNRHTGTDAEIGMPSVNDFN